MNNLTVGQFYKVPLVRAIHLSRKPQWWPVLGTMHEDREIIGFDQYHFHADHRFVTDVDYHKAFPIVHPMFTTPISIRNIVRPGTDMAFWESFGSAQYHAGEVEPDLEQRIMRELDPDDKRWFRMGRRKCRWAQMPAYPYTRPPWLRDLQHAYRRANALRPDGSLVCPHRGIPLDNLGTYDGCVECPLHGLRWNPETGALVPWPDEYDGP